MKTLRRIGFYVIALVFFVWAVFPFYYAVVTSLKTGFAVMTPSLWPHAPMRCRGSAFADARHCW
ncbi:MAG: hypothetical protein P8011_19095 [Acidihalobacter sp.]